MCICQCFSSKIYRTTFLLGTYGLELMNITNGTTETTFQIEEG